MVATTRLGLNAQTPGTNANTWGGTLNDQVIALVDEAVAGVETIPVAGNMTLTSTNFVSNQARNLALLFTAGGLTAGATITIPGREKVYLVLNSTGHALTFSAGGATATLATGRWGFIVCSGSDVLGFDPVGLTDNARIQAETARDISQQWASLTGALVNGTDYSSKEYAIGTTAPAGSSKSWAQKTGSAVSGTDWSSKEHAVGTLVPTGSAAGWASKTGSAVVGTDYSAKEHAVGTATPAGSSQAWATKTGSAVASGEFSAKEHAAGTSVMTGSAKSWASTTGSAVAGGEYAAKEYAIGDLTATGGSAKAWAVDAASPNGTTDKSAKSYAADALASAQAAATFDPSNYYGKTASDARYVPQAGKIALTGALYDTVIDKGTVSSGTVTFDVSQGEKQRLQVGGALTIALSGKPASAAWELEIELVNGGAAALVWPTVSWLKGDGTVGSAFSDMGVVLQAAGTNTVLLWGTGSGAVRGRAG